MNEPGACGLPAPGTTRLARVSAWLACRRCLAGWALYLAAAALAIAFAGGV